MLIKEHLTLQLSGKDHKKVPSDVLTHYIASSLTSLLIWWFDHVLPYPGEQMNDIFQELTEHGVESVIGQIELEQHANPLSLIEPILNTLNRRDID